MPTPLYYSGLPSQLTDATACIKEQPLFQNIKHSRLFYPGLGQSKNLFANRQQTEQTRCNFIKDSSWFVSNWFPLLALLELLFMLLVTKCFLGRRHISRPSISFWKLTSSTFTNHFQRPYSSMYKFQSKHEDIRSFFSRALNSCWRTRTRHNK